MRERSDIDVGIDGEGGTSPIANELNREFGQCGTRERSEMQTLDAMQRTVC